MTLESVSKSGIDSNLLNQDFIKDSQFDVAGILDTLFNGDVLIPATLPNLPQKSRLTYCNKTFVHNFVGLCIWKHMNNGDVWVKSNDLNVKKTPDNIIKFQHHVRVIRDMYHDKYWKPMSELDIDDIDPKLLFNFCANTRNLIIKGVWNNESKKIEGIYFMWKEMLVRIGFKMDQSSAL